MISCHLSVSARARDAVPPRPVLPVADETAKTKPGRAQRWCLLTLFGRADWSEISGKTPKGRSALKSFWRRSLLHAPLEAQGHLGMNLARYQSKPRNIKEYAGKAWKILC